MKTPKDLKKFIIDTNVDYIKAKYNMGGNENDIGEFVCVFKNDDKIPIANPDIISYVTDFLWQNVEFFPNSDGFYIDENGEVELSYDAEDESFHMIKCGYEYFEFADEIDMPNVIDHSDPDLSEITSIYEILGETGIIVNSSDIRELYFSDIEIYYDKNKVITDTIKQKETAILDKINDFLNTYTISRENDFDVIRLLSIEFIYQRSITPQLILRFESMNKYLKQFIYTIEEICQTK